MDKADGVTEMAPMQIRKVSQMEKVLGALHRLYAAQDTEEFPSIMMSVADEVVPCVNLTFDIIETATGAARNGFLREPPMTHEDFMERWSYLHHEHPGISFLKRGGKASVISLSDFMTEREFRAGGLYQEIFKPIGVLHQLGIILPVEGHVVGVAMNRDTRFTDEERQLIEHLQPHFVQAFERTQLSAALRGIPPVDFLPWRRHGLTRRECDVLRWLMEGKRNREIALMLSLRPRTVDTHVVNLFTKLGVQTRTAAANRAREILRFPPALR